MQSIGRSALLLICSFVWIGIAQATDRYKITPLMTDDAMSSDDLGHAVSLFSDLALIGASHHEGANRPEDSGAAYLFKHENGSWRLLKKLEASAPSRFDFFGRAVALTSDVAFVGAEWHDSNGLTNSGAVYVFQKQSNGNWIETQKLVSSRAEAYSYFGSSIAVSENLVLIGARSEGDLSSGAAYLFEKQADGGWLEIQRLQAVDQAAHDYFGTAVALRNNRALVGAFAANRGNYRDAGAAYLFEAIGSSWRQTRKFVSPQLIPHELFAGAVALSSNRAVFGAMGSTSSVYQNAGSTYVFKLKLDGSWVYEQQLLASDEHSEHQFGGAVKILSDRILVGAPGYKSDQSGAGAAYMFRHTKSGWIESQKILPPNPSAGDRFGVSIALDGSRAVIGSESNGAIPTGSAYILQRTEPSIFTPRPWSKLSGPTATFYWDSSGLQISDWWLYVGTSVELRPDVYDSGPLGGDTFSLTVDNLPTDGMPLYIKLWYREGSDGLWSYAQTNYVAAGKTPKINFPLDDDYLVSSAQSFSWESNNAKVRSYWLTVGSSRGSGDYFSSGDLGVNTTIKTHGLPVNGSEVWVRLWYRQGDVGHWKFLDTRYNSLNEG